MSNSRRRKKKTNKISETKAILRVLPPTGDRTNYCEWIWQTIDKIAWIWKVTGLETTLNTELKKI